MSKPPGGRGARLGIVTTGKTYLEVREALSRLGLSTAQAESLGLAVYKVAIPWPLEPQGLTRFASGLETLLVVEENRPLIKAQARDILYPLPASARPVVVGKRDEAGRDLRPARESWTPPACLAASPAICVLTCRRAS